MRLRRGAIALVGLVACRFAGPTGNPDEYVAFPGSDGGVVDASTATDDRGFVAPRTDASTGPSGRDAASFADAPFADPSGDDAPLDDAAEGGSCSATVAVCNPVRNTGCNALQQCDVDPSQTKTPTGLCVFYSGPTDAGPCLATIFTESCPPQFTCVSGGCRELCLCDADCPAGQCCSDTSGPSGFTLCRPCP